jgi:hypothetical protein
MKSTYKILIGVCKGEKPFGRPSHRWESDIKMDLKVACCEDLYWIHLALNVDQWWAIVKMVMNL